LTFDERLRQNETNGNFPLLEERVILNEIFETVQVETVITAAFFVRF